MLAEPRQSLRFGAIGDFRTGGPATRVPDRLDIVNFFRRERKVVVLTGKSDAGGTAVDGRIVCLQQARTMRELGCNPGEIFGLSLRRHRWRTERKSLVIPELLDVFSSADAQQLQAFKIGTVRQQYVSNMVRLIARVGETDHKRKSRHRLADSFGVPKRNRRIRSIDNPNVRR